MVWRTGKNADRLSRPITVRFGERATSTQLNPRLATFTPAVNAAGPAPTSIEAFASLPRLPVVTRCPTEHFHRDSAHGRIPDASRCLPGSSLGAGGPPCYRRRRRVHDGPLAPTRRTLR